MSYCGVEEESALLPHPPLSEAKTPRRESPPKIPNAERALLRKSAFCSGVILAFPRKRVKVSIMIPMLVICPISRIVPIILDATP